MHEIVINLQTVNKACAASTADNPVRLGHYPGLRLVKLTFALLILQTGVALQYTCSWAKDHARNWKSPTPRALTCNSSSAGSSGSRTFMMQLCRHRVGF